MNDDNIQTRGQYHAGDDDGDAVEGKLNASGQADAAAQPGGEGDGHAFGAPNQLRARIEDQNQAEGGEHMIEVIAGIKMLND